MPKNKVIDEKLSALPHLPGVYIMKNVGGSIIYVGKSKNLKNRVSSYFKAPETLNAKTKKLVSNICDFEFIITHSEAEALILENELIKKHLPKYNIKLKDSKSYPYIKISGQDFPRLYIAHTKRNDKSKYFGPYTSANAVKDIIKTVQTIFKLPSCEKHLEYGKKISRPCLNFHINKCTAPCSGKITPSEYMEVFPDIEMFLNGDYSKVKASLTRKMQFASDNLNFENAAKYRDSIKNLEKLSVHQKIKLTPGIEKDVFGLYETETHSALAILLVRDGVIIDKNIIHINADEIFDSESVSDLVLRYYANPETIPKNITLSFEIDREIMTATENILSDKSGHKVTIQTPKKGTNKNLCKMAVDNALEAINQKLKQEENDTSLLVRLADALHLEVLPERIESYDISNNGNDDIYCGMIVISGGKFLKSDYRAFSIKTLDGVDDYGAMKEALTRRFSHFANNNLNDSLSRLPDLILLDGGIGQVSVVKEIAENMGINVPIFGMVKDKFHKTRTITDGENEISIAKDTLLFSFIYKIQEEVHRFTFSKMDAARRKRMKKLELTNITGIGQAKAKALYEHFKSLDELKKANVNEIASVKGINNELAVKIKEYIDKEF